jgi:hypothetical protein
MERNYSSTKLPTAADTQDTGHTTGSTWANPSRITANDGSSATWAAFSALQGATIRGKTFNFQTLPAGTVIDGMVVTISGSRAGNAYGNITPNLAGCTPKAIGALNGTYGSPTDKWGLTTINPADIPGLIIAVDTNDFSGALASASMDYMSVTLYWHIEPTVAEADVPTRVDYQMFNSAGSFLGLVPNVTSKLAFSQDINSAGSTIQIVSGQSAAATTTVDTLLDNTGAPILTNNNDPILTSSTETLVALGSSDENVLFKNGNRVQVMLYNYWYPNGKLMFSGQVNRVNLKYGGGTAIQMTVYSDGIDLDNFIARGYPFSYTTEVSQTSSTDKVSLIQDVYGAFTYYGQTFKTGAAQTTVGEIQLMMDGAAWVNVYLMDGPYGNVLGSVSKYIVAPDLNTVISFDFAQLIDVLPSTNYFIRVTVANNNSIWLYRNSAGGYADGEMYQATYSGGSGGGSMYPNGGGDIYFVVKSGLPTTTTTYSTQDPVSGMAHKILLDYNARGGIIKERNFTATALSLTYTFVVATILDVIKKVIELAPSGYFYYIDLGTAKIDILPTSATADFTIVRGRDIQTLDLSLTIEQVKNYLLLSGGPTAGVNLFRDYADANSSSRYGIRLASKSDNRITVAATADAVGSSFITENSSETQETTVTVLNKNIDITLLTPGKTIGFRNFGSFIDNMVLQITRRDYNTEYVNLTLGRLPTTMPAEIQRLNRELLQQQTIDNPSAPS